MRRYAQDTAVPISRSRGEIDKLLRAAWGATGIQWTDEFEHDRVTLRFIWPRGDTRFTARFDLRLPTAKSFEGEATDKRSGKLLQTKLQRLLDARGKHEHRVLALWIKAALNAVDAGIVPPEVLFLPFIENKQGKTVAEATLPALMSGGSVTFPALLVAP
jgi:hypothetical protein